MQAYGSDRVRPGQGEQVILLSRLDKGWTARVPKTLTTAEFPGTAVLWEERYFEVAAIEPLPQGGWRYILEPWREQLAMRVTDRYDPEAEAVRADEYRKTLRREKARKSANALGLFTGHLPAIVQEDLGRELGILPARLTLISILGEYGVIAGLVLWSVALMIRQEPIPFGILIAAGIIGVENTIRFLVNWTQSRPIGSVVGWILYAIYHAISGRGPSPFATEKGWAVKISEPPAEVAARDAITMREPFLTLLTPAEQARIAARYDYDYKRESTAVAVTILIVAGIGVVSSLMTGAVLSLIGAAALGTEQIVRLAAFRRGPAGSVLRFVVRPFVRKLIA